MHVEFRVQMDTVDCIRLVTQKAASEKMRSLDTKEVVSVMKIIDLDAEVSTEKIMVAPVFEINVSGIHTVIALMNQETTMLLQIVMLVSEIRCLGTLVFLLVPRLADIVTKEQYP